MGFWRGFTHEVARISSLAPGFVFIALVAPTLTARAEEEVWMPSDLQDINLYGLAAGTSNTVWAVGQRTFGEGAPQCLYHSTDGGDRWTTSPVGVPAKVHYAGGLVVDDVGRLWAATWDGVHRLSASEDTWTTMGLAGEEVAGLDFLADGTLYAGVGKGLFRSRDYGETWTQILDVPWVRCVARLDDGTLFAAIDCLYRSNDDGATWEPLFFLEFLHDIIRVDMVVQSSAALLVGYVGVFGGRVFRWDNSTDTAEFVLRLGVFAMAGMPHGTVYVGGGWLGDTRGVQRSFDHGDTWSVLNAGFISPENMLSIPHFAVTPTGQLLAAPAYRRGEGRYLGGVYRLVNQASARSTWVLY